MSDRGHLLERERELADLRARCQAAAAGVGGVIAVRGPAGIGKTALVEAAVREARASGLMVLRATGSELEGDLAFGVVRQLFERVLRELADQRRDDVLAGAGGLAAQVVLEPAAAPPRAEAVHSALHGLYWLAVEMSATSPLLVCVDDAHWADVSSLRWLAYLARRLDGVAMLLVIAARDFEPGSDMQLLDRALSEASVEVMRPAAFSEAAVRNWLTAAYEQPPDPAFLRGCLVATGGNPLLLAELTAQLRMEGVEPSAEAAQRASGAAPAAIGRSVLTRLARLGSGAVSVAEAVAVLSQDARLDRVAALSGIAIDQAARVADELIASSILVGGPPIAFAHPVLRAAVYEQIPDLRRGLTHAAAARLVSDDERAAGHLLLAPASRDAWAEATLRSAARAARARGAPEVARTLLRRALAEPPQDHAAVLLELASAEAAAQDPAAVEHARAALLAADQPRRRADAAILMARCLTMAGRFDEALEALTDAERQLDGLDRDARLTIEAETLMQRGWHRGSQGVGERLRALGVDDLAGDTPAERALMAVRVIEIHTSGGDRELALALARRLLAHDDLRRPDVEAVLGLGFATSDQIDEGRALLTGIVERGRARGDLGAVAMGCAMRADAELRAGRLTAADTDAQEALMLALEHNINFVVPVALAAVVEVLLEQRPAPEALALLARHGFLDGAIAPVYTIQGLLLARGRARAAAGDAYRATADLRAYGAAQLRLGDRNPAKASWRSSLALVLGHTAEAARLADEELRDARAYGATRAIGIALRARALLETGNAQQVGLRDAVRTLATSPARLEHARALVDLGAALRRGGHRRQARVTLAEGLDGAVACAAHQLAERARDELRAAGARPHRERLHGPQALTSSERRVSQLAADGLTNRQIAQALFVTTKTVEMHLSHAYAKLGITGRDQISGALSDHAIRD